MWDCLDKELPKENYNNDNFVELITNAKYAFKIFSDPVSKGKNERVGCSFFAVVPFQPFDQTILYQDGAVLLLSEGSWMLLKQCFSLGSNCFVQSDVPEGLNAEVSFFKTIPLKADDKASSNKVDTHQHSESHTGILGGKLRSPKDASQKVDDTSPDLMILTPHNQLEKCISLEDLAKYARHVTELIQVNLLSKSSYVDGLIGQQYNSESSRQLVLQFDLHPASSKPTATTSTSALSSITSTSSTTTVTLDLKVAFRPIADNQQDLLNSVKADVVNAIAVVQLPNVDGLVQFQLYFPLKRRDVHKDVSNVS